MTKRLKERWRFIRSPKLTWRGRLRFEVGRYRGFDGTLYDFRYAHGAETREGRPAGYLVPVGERTDGT